ncbi:MULTISPECIES: conjugal transfer protein [unclassified Streptomyces]|uniref:conjugal transfer protein n=1 Tax=unclassified Streptomyces TaxID=2593676 RepID=UPI000DBA48CD|nr:MULTISPECIES: conjugal transfer protein [unclassified Streptomyces]MYT68347.1 conjugal transfer protein [Streptomyces sp. SID8367]RAJ76984.1 conjugative transposon protein TcpC [Streptomyces sp. PsTaAH-137]
MPSTTEKAPPTAAGVELARTRRTVRLGRAGVWACLMAGPAALALALTQPATTVVAQAAPAPARTAAAAPLADPSGYAAEFVDAWLRADADHPDSHDAVRALRMGPDVALPEPAESAKAPRTVSAVRSVPRTGGRWSVTVAAQYADGVRYFAVPVTSSASGDAVTVAGAPALVAAPGAAKAAPSAYRVDVPDGPLADTVGDFLTAYLTGSGDVDRYLSPRTALSAVSPAVAEEVDVDVVSAREEAAAAESVPADRVRVHVQAGTRTLTNAGVWPLSYELTLTARGGRWEITALTSGGGAAK